MSKGTNKAAWIGAVALILAAIITGYMTTDKDSDPSVETSGSSSPAAASSGDNSPVTQNFYGGTNAKEMKPLKERIRDYLREINPEIIQRIDSGEMQVCAMINMVNVKELVDLSTEGDFASYLSFSSTGSVIMGGSGNRMGNCINDKFEGTLHGYVLQIKPALRI